MNLKRVQHLFSLVLCALPLSLPLLAACHGSPDDVVAETRDTGEVNVGVSAQAMTAADVAKITLTVTAADMATSIVRDLVEVNGQWTGVLGGIPVGTNRTFHADAYDAFDVKLAQAEVTGVTISTGAPAAVLLVFQPEVAPNPYANSAPQISSLILSSGKVLQGQTVSLAVTAADPDSDPLTYAWTATGGSFDDAAVANPTWTAPASDGTYTLDVSVTDGKGGQAGISVQVVVASGGGTATVSTEFNNWPVVTGMSAMPGQLHPGQSSSLSVTANDADGDPITYVWSDDCGGTFSDTTATTPTWTAPPTAPAGDTCTLTIAVSDDNGGSTSGTLVVGLNLPDINLPPVVDLYSQSALSIYATEQVDMWLTAYDPEGSALSFSWSAADGTLGTATDTASSSEVLWTAPAAAGTFTITATVQDANGQPATHTFSVDVSGMCSDGIQNYGETGLDCGGPCGSCATCSDGIQNQGETGIDCGGPCTSCETCSDGIQNQGETDIDCGGPCAGCQARMFARGNRVVILRSDSTVWGAGYNGSGQLGDGSTVRRTSPVQVSGLSNVVAVAGTGDGSVAAKSDGTVWAWGNTNNGTGNHTTPIQITGLSDVIRVAEGSGYALALKSDGTVWGWGSNWGGFLGDGTNTDRMTPVQVSGLSGVKAITAGSGVAAALKSDGTVWTWGYGFLGNGSGTSSNVPVQVPTLSNVTSIANGDSHILVLKSDGTVWGWGDNMWGELGNGCNAAGNQDSCDINTPAQATGVTGAIAIAADGQCSMVVKSDGTAWIAGLNSRKLGPYGNDWYHTFTSAGMSSASTTIAVAYWQGMAMSQSGDYYFWGGNPQGQFGLGTTSDNNINITVAPLWKQ